MKTVILTGILTSLSLTTFAAPNADLVYDCKSEDGLVEATLSEGRDSYIAQAHWYGLPPETENFECDANASDWPPYASYKCTEITFVSGPYHVLIFKYYAPGRVEGELQKWSYEKPQGPITKLNCEEK